MKRNLHKLTNVEPSEFDALALQVFEHQRTSNPVYAEWLSLTRQSELRPKHWQEIPCAPISLFRNHGVRTGQWSAETVFRSSGTQGVQSSKHAIRDLEAYQAAARTTFEAQHGSLSDYMLLALLPNYLEQGNSGLVAMIDGFMPHCIDGSGYFLQDFSALRDAAQSALPAASSGHTTDSHPVLLWGVSFALLDLVEAGPLVLPKGSLVIETGGMKGRRTELTRSELHGQLSKSIVDPTGASIRIGSEYGMTELQSQAYLDQSGHFVSGNAMRIAVREINDPYALRPTGKTGAINAYDLANMDTLSFIATDDLGYVLDDGRFSVLGRLDNSLRRGCNLLYTEH